jgi:hypothetical protein
MSDVIYWAIKITEKSREKLLVSIPPRHENIYADHITMVFNPTPDQNKKFEQWLGKEASALVVSVFSDDKGQAVGVITEPQRPDGKMTHITISCADGTKAVYSNELIEKQKDRYNTIHPFSVEGIIAKYTKNGWKYA